MCCLRDKRPQEHGRLAVLSLLINVPLIYSFRRFGIIKGGALFLKTNCLGLRAMQGRAGSSKDTYRCIVQYRA